MHEAGHAVAAAALGLPLVGVDIKRRVMPGGQVSVGFTNAPVNFSERAKLDAMPCLIQPGFPR